jgi:methyl-accepting chemotaxis protein
MRLTIGKKLGLGFGIVLLILLALGIVTLTQMRIIGRHVTNVGQTQEPLAEAAYSMDIGLLRTGFGMLGYLETHDPSHLDRIKVGRDSFAEARKQYQELAKRSGGAQEALLVEKAGKEYDDFSKAADLLIALEDRQNQDIETLLKSYDQLDQILDEKIQTSIRKSDPQAYDKTQASMEMEININGIAKGLGYYLQTGQARYQDGIKQDQEDFNRFFNIYERLNLSSQERQYAQQIRRLFDEGTALVLGILKGHEEMEDGIAQFVEMRRKLGSIMADEMLPLADKQMNQAGAGAHRSVSTASALTVLLFLLSLVVGALAATIITRGITKPVRMVVDRVNEIAGSAGDLTATVAVASDDEIGDLAKAFNGMISGLRGMVAKIHGNSESVSASSQQLSSAAQQTNASVQQVSSAIQQLSKGAQTQAQRVEETNRALEQLNVSVSQTAQSAQQAASTSSQATQSAQRGVEKVKDAVETMNRIDNSTTHSAQAVAKLGRRSEQMAEIVDVITNVAEQTNLLALNAAIEAARAGEAGSGFAVVAEEVRKLAENSAKSATQIGKLIKETIGETESAVKNMEVTSNEVVSGKEIIAQVGTGLDEILQGSQNVATMLQQISVATQQMSEGAKQVAKSGEDIATIAEQASASTQQASASTQEMVATMQEMASSAESLAQMGINLNKLVAQFKVGEELRTTRTEPRAPRRKTVGLSMTHRLAEAKNRIRSEKEEEELVGVG